MKVYVPASIWQRLKFHYAPWWFRQVFPVKLKEERSFDRSSLLAFLFSTDSIKALFGPTVPVLFRRSKPN